MGASRTARRKTGSGDEEQDFSFTAEKIIKFYQGLRREASLLLDHGHPHANNYPLAKLWSEATIVRQRLNSNIKTDATMMQAVIASVIGGSKNNVLKGIFKELDDGS